MPDDEFGLPAEVHGDYFGAAVCDLFVYELITSSFEKYMNLKERTRERVEIFLMRSYLI